MKILIVEDEEMLAKTLETLFRSNGFETKAVSSGESGAACAQEGIYDLVIMDVMLPGIDGFEAVRKIRKAGINTPVLMLTARSDISDRIEGLNSGADYYLPKPFDSGELLACVRALLRRQGEQMNLLSRGNTFLDTDTSMLRCGDKKIRLSAKEFEVMRQLMLAGERNITKDFLLETAWGLDSEAVDNNVEVYVGFLRRKLRSIGSNVRIEAIRNVGYHLEADE